MKCYYLLLLPLLSATRLYSQQITPSIPLEGQWELAGSFSDEFNADQVDMDKWITDVNDWGTWSWEPENVYQKDGLLHIRMAYEPHQRGSQELFLTSGILKSKDRITYGFFESRFKCAHLIPGTCPAFWMKGPGPSGQNCEVDFMELRESDPLNKIAINLHAHVDTDGDGVNEWVRQNRDFINPWDPRDDYHIYACHTTADSITWYIDGQLAGEAPNTYWHFPMNVMLSMGVRTPYRTFKIPNPEYPEAQKNWPDPEATRRDKDLFPTEMLVDYVRVWTPLEKK